MGCQTVVVITRAPRSEALMKHFPKVLENIRRGVWTFRIE